MNNKLRVSVLLRLDRDLGDGMVFETEPFTEAMEEAIERGVFLHFGQQVSEELDLMNAIGKIEDFEIENGLVFLNVDFLDVPFSKATYQRLEKGWTTTSMKALGNIDADKVVHDIKILGFVESLKN